MIYRRPIRDVVEERNGRTCGIHVFAFYIIALAAIVGMSTACLTATEGGFFSFVQRITLSKPAVAGMQVDYEVTYGWQSMCSEADVYSIVGGLQDSVYGCFPLGETVTLTDVKSVKLAAGSPMTEETGLAVALGHGVAAAMSAIHVLFFVMLYFNIDPVPIRGYPYMRGLGLMTALASFYLLFSCVVSFYFAVRGCLEVDMKTSNGLRPSWAYLLTVVNVAAMVTVGMMACQDDQIDAAIATPQYTSSSRDEDTVKRANGKLLHLRSKSSDTICDGMPCALSQPTSTVAPKATVSSDPHPSATSVLHGGGVGSGSTTAFGGPDGGGGGGGDGGGNTSTSRMSAAAASAAAHAASTFGRLGAASPAPSASVMSGWTGRVSGISPLRRREDGQGGSSGDMDHIIDRYHRVVDGRAGIVDAVDDGGECRDVERGDVEAGVVGSDGQGSGGGDGEGGGERERGGDEADGNGTAAAAHEGALVPETYASTRTVIMGPGFCSGVGSAAVSRVLEGLPPRDGDTGARTAAAAAATGTAAPVGPARTPGWASPFVASAASRPRSPASDVGRDVVVAGGGAVSDRAVDVEAGTAGRLNREKGRAGPVDGDEERRQELLERVGDAPSRPSFLRDAGRAAGGGSIVAGEEVRRHKSEVSSEGADVRERSVSAGADGAGDGNDHGDANLQSGVVGLETSRVSGSGAAGPFLSRDSAEDVPSEKEPGAAAATVPARPPESSAIPGTVQGSVPESTVGDVRFGDFPGGSRDTERDVRDLGEDETGRAQGVDEEDDA